MADEIRGDKTLRRVLGQIAAKTPIGIGIELDNQAEILRARAIAVAPELTRKLILSSKVTKRDSRTRAIRVISFDTDYAVVRHEDFYNLGPISSAKSPTQDGPPGRKYLERPFRNMNKPIQEAVGEVPEDVAREVVRKNRGRD
jgi:hypothetical protein